MRTSAALGASDIMLRVTRTGAHTSYTLWNHDRLVGHTDLDYPGTGVESRMGTLAPTPYGEQLIADMTDAHRVRDPGMATADPGDAAAVHLQLRGPDGAIIETRAIAIQDTERLVFLPHDGFGEADREHDPPVLREQQWPGAPRPELASFDECFDESDDVESDFAAAARESWAEPAIPRYHIVVDLADAWSIP